MTSSTLHLPKAINEKTNFIKAFCVELKVLHVIPPDDISAIQAAEYAYQQAKYTAKEAAALYADSVFK